MPDDRAGRRVLAGAEPERLDTVLAERVHLIAPMTPSAETLADGKRAFAELLELIPDLDGLATERISYFDSLPLVLRMARRPRAWPSFLRSRLSRLRR